MTISRILNRLAVRGLATLFGFALFLIGIGFFTVAAWFGLAASYGAVMASMIQGTVFVTLAGLILLAEFLLGRSSSAPKKEMAEPVEILHAFLGGMEQGRSARN